MGFERRRNGVYYYDKKRRNGKVVSRYVGNGEFAELLAEVRQVLREEEEGRRREREELRARHEADDAAVRESEETVRRVLAEVFTAAGFHYHKGTWRRKRSGEGDKEGGAEGGREGR